MKISQKGFTLIETMVVIGILVVLFGIVLVAINPSRQFSLANNTKRKSDTKAILDAVHEYAIDNKGILPAGIATTSLTIRKAGGADLCSLLVTRYLAALPVDPLTNGGNPVSDCNSAYNTNYVIVRSAGDNRITVSAPAAELQETITIIR